MITNTTKNPRYDWVLGGNPEAIEDQEAQGQRELVNANVLPVKMDDIARNALETAGVIFRDVVEGDPIFQHVTLPEGWRKTATDHSMWSDLLDEKGRKRAGIFYKAAFYDRSSHLHIERRFTVERDYERSDYEDVSVFHVKDCGAVIYSTETLKLPAEQNTARYDLANSPRKDAEAWLRERYPDWQNPTAYWEV